MKALMLTQPWATLVALGKKKIETRSWATSYRGPLAIHAAKGFPRPARNLTAQEPFFSALGKGFNYDYLPLGAVIATCELVNVMRIPAPGGPSLFPLTDRERQVLVRLPPPNPEFSFGDYTPGRWAWLLANIKALPEPIPATGSLGLWEWNEHALIAMGQGKAVKA